MADFDLIFPAHGMSIFAKWDLFQDKIFHLATRDCRNAVAKDCLNQLDTVDNGEYSKNLS